MSEEFLKLFYFVVEQVKDGSKGVKSAYRGLRSKLKDTQTSQHFENGLEVSLDKPRSAPNSPTGKRRAAGFSMPTTTYRKDSAMSFKTAGVDRLLFLIYIYIRIFFLLKKVFLGRTVL